MSTRLLGLLPIVSKFKKEDTTVTTLEDAISFVYRFHYRRATIKPLQVEEEIFLLIKKVQELAPQAVLEIGTSHGGTLYLFCRASSLNAQIISIDLRGGRFGGGYSRLRIPLYRSFAREKQKVHLINADSHHHSTPKRVRDILRGRQVDFLFVDGDHTYEGVKADFETYSQLVRTGGIIALHDILEHPAEQSVGVQKFWNEIKAKYKSEEIIKDKNQGWAGIGLLYRLPQN